MHERFRFASKDQLIIKAKQLGLELPFSDGIRSLLEPVLLEDHIIQNRMVVLPMEGYDSETDGSPSDLTRRRYIRYAEGGSGIIWFEAVSISHKGRSNPHQLWLHSDNMDKFESLADAIRHHALAYGYDPLLVIQLTHSGRYCKPEGHPAPQVPARNPLLDKGSLSILSDDDLRRIEDQFIASSKLAMSAGFDAIDVKACHGYLLHELLSCKERTNSIYGGLQTKGRFRLLMEIIDRIKNEVPGILITSRISIWDGYTGGFGVNADGIEPDFTEPELLIEELISKKIKLINLTMGSPYFNPHIVRPFDKPIPGTPPPEEHPMIGVMRMIDGISHMQQKFPGLFVVGSAYSYLRQFAPHVGAAVLDNQGASFIGFGRSSFAYPSLPGDLMEKGYADPKKICITCSGCSRLIGNLRPGGCVIRDRDIYGTELKKLISDGK